VVGSRVVRLVGRSLMVLALTVATIPAAPGGVALATQASPPPPASPSPTPAPPTAPPSPRPGPSGFFDQVGAYATSVYPVFGRFRTAFGTGDLHQDDVLVGQLAQASDDLVRWLDANPPAICYAESWVAFRAAATQLGAMFARYVLMGLDGITDQLIGSGVALQAATATVPATAAACGVVLPSPSASSVPVA